MGACGIQKPMNSGPWAEAFLDRSHLQMGSLKVSGFRAFPIRLLLAGGA